MYIDIFCVSLTTCLMTVSGLFILQLIYDPASMLAIGALIPPNFFYCGFKIAVILFYSFMTIVLLTNTLVVVICIFCYGYFVINTLHKELHLGLPGGYLAPPHTREADTIRLWYRAFQLLNGNIMCFVGLYVALSSVICTLSAIYGIATLFRFWGMLNVVAKTLLVLLTIVTLIIWAFIAEVGRMFFTRGNKLLGSWKRNQWKSKQERELMRRFEQSCPPILIAYGRELVLRRVSILKFCRGVIRGTKRVLLTVKL